VAVGGSRRVPFATLVDNFMGWCARNSAADTPTAALHGEVCALRKEAGIVMVMGRIDPSLPGSGAILDAYLAEVGAGLPEATVTVQENEPWLYNLLNLPDEAAAFGLQASKLRTKIKSAYLKVPLDAGQRDTLFRCLTDPRYGWAAGGVMFATWGGAMNALGPGDTAIIQRDSIMQMSFINSWNDAGDDDRHLDWIRSCYRDVFASTGGVPVRDDRTDGAYINWPDVDLADPALNSSGVPWSTLYYGDNYAKLRRVKARWDPRGMFTHALSIEGC
jgi:aclacinomycin oxidase